jgi:hypothetical protein
MRKLGAFLLILLLSVYYIPNLHAEGIALSDAEMDEIAAGEWVLAYEPAAKDKNLLKIEDGSQAEIKAVNNVNTVDSAAAVQNNISNAVEGALDTNQGNNATVQNASEKDTFSLNLDVDANVGIKETNTHTEKKRYHRQRAKQLERVEHQFHS